MDDNKSKVDSKKIDSFNLSMSAGDNKIKYYECNNNNCTFEILDEEKSDEKSAQQYCEKQEKIKEEKNKIYGQIIVTSILDCREHEYLQGVKINLYKINGLSPVLMESQITNKQGKVTFDKIEEGCYRIIEIVDKRYFEKPKYIDWNEVTIDAANKNQTIVVVNKIKKIATKAYSKK